MQFDVIILAGGKSSRLGGTPKSELLYQGESLLCRTVRAASRANNIVVIGDNPGFKFERVVNFVREKPKYAGPAAAIAAGIQSLSSPRDASFSAPSMFTLVLACDMPDIASAVVALTNSESSAQSDVDGVIARDENGQDQYLVALYRTSALQAAVRSRVEAGEIDGLAVRTLIGHLTLVPVNIPPGSSDDIDTWADAARFGLEPDGTSSIGK